MTIRIEGAGEAFASLGHFFTQASLNNAKPIGISRYLILSINNRNRVFQV